MGKKLAEAGIADAGAVREGGCAPQRTGVKNSLGAVLHIPPKSDSLFYRSYEQRLRAECLLEWSVTRFRANYPTTELIVLVHTNRDRGSVSSILGGSVRLFESRYATPLRGYAEVATHLGSADVAFFGWGASLAPLDLLEKLYKHHVSQGNHFTEAIRIPRAASYEIYNSSLLCHLARQCLPLTVTTPSAAIKHLELPLACEPYDPLPDYPGWPVNIPLDASLESREETETLKRVLSTAGECDSGPSSPLGLLNQWSRARQRSGEGRNTPWPMPALRAGHLGRPYRLLYVSSNSALTGGEQSLCNLVESLDRRKFEPHALVAVEGVFTQRLRRAGVNVICPMRSFAGATLDNFSYTQRVVGQVAPHVAHLNSVVGLPILVALKNHGVCVVQSVKVAELAPYREQIACADAVIAVSGFIKSKISEFVQRPTKTYVVPSGVNVEKFRSSALKKDIARQHYHVAGGGQVILAVANFIPRKRHDLLIEAFEILAASLPELRLLMAGERFAAPACFDSVFDLVRRRELEGKVLFLDFEHDMRRPLAAADVLVLCSDGEPGGLSLMEAMSMEVPVVVTGSDGKEEIVKNGLTGLVVPTGNASALAGAIKQVLLDTQLSQRLRRAGRESIVNTMSASRCASATMEIYDRVIRSH